MGLSGGHLWMAGVVLVVVLVIWGPGKLGEIGGALGRGLHEFKRAANDTDDKKVAAPKE